MSVDFKEIGETYVGDNPAIMKVKRVTMGASSAGVDVAFTAAGVYELFEIPAGTLVWAAKTRITEAFSGTTPTLNIGDTDSAVWCATATVAPASTGVMLKFGGDGSIFSDTDMGGGKIYDAAQAINATLGDTWGGAGVCELYVCYAEAGLL